MADDFAVVGTGGDYLTIQESINDGANSIFLKAGVHTVSQAITLFQGCHIFGESGYNTVVDFQDEAYNFLINFDDITIENIRVVNCMNANGAFVFSTAANSMVRDCRVEAGTRASCFIESTYCVFENNLCLNQHLEAVWLNEMSTDNRVSNNRITDSENYGIRVLGAFNKFMTNTVSGCANDGVLLVAANNIVHGNTCNHNANGIYVAQENGDHNVITSNICRDNEGYGVNVNSIENAGNIVTGNVLRDNGVADLRFVPGNFVELNDAYTVV